MVDFMFGFGACPGHNKVFCIDLLRSMADITDSMWGPLGRIWAYCLQIPFVIGWMGFISGFPNTYASKPVS